MTQDNEDLPPIDPTPLDGAGACVPPDVLEASNILAVQVLRSVDSSKILREMTRLLVETQEAVLKELPNQKTALSTTFGLLMGALVHSSYNLLDQAMRRRMLDVLGGVLAAMEDIQDEDMECLRKGYFRIRGLMKRKQQR